MQIGLDVNPSAQKIAEVFRHAYDCDCALCLWAWTWRTDPTSADDVRRLPPNLRERVCKLLEKRQGG